MILVFCGPPHSGKSVLIANLKKRLPDDCLRVLRACPDGEGDWSNEEGDFNADVRNKGAYTEELVSRYCRAIDNNQDSKIVIVDVGGKRTKENEEIFSHCDAYAVLCAFIPEMEGETIRWQRFADGIEKKNAPGEHLRCFALLDSDLNGEEKIYSNSGEIIRGKLAGLERKTQLKDSPLLDLIASTIIRDSGYKIEDSRNLSLERLSGLALAYRVGCQKTEMIGDAVVPKAFWTYESIAKVYDTLSEMVLNDQNNTTTVNIDAVRPAFILCACAKSLYDAGIETVTTMDSEHNEFIPIRKIEKKEAISETDGLQYHIIEGKDGVFLDVDVEGQDFTLEEYEKCVLPYISEEKPLYVSGRVPNYLMASIAISYNSPSISVLQPPKGFVCTCAQDKSMLGTLKDSINGINLDKYFRDKKEALKMSGKFEMNPNNYLEDEKSERGE